MSYKGEILFPVLVDYPESKFGGFLAVTDYKDPVIPNEINAERLGALAADPLLLRHDQQGLPRPLGLDNGSASAIRRRRPGRRSATLCDAPADQIARYQATRQPQLARPRRPGPRRRRARHLRLPHLGAVRPDPDVVSSVVGVAAGAVQGYFGGRVDLIFQRFLEIWSSIPSLFVLIIISSVLVPGFWTLLGILLMFSWTIPRRRRARRIPARPQLRIHHAPHARSGCPTGKIMFKHLLPNAMVATLTFLPFQLSGGIAALTALDFLGLGLPPGSPSLGELLLQGKSTSRRRGSASPASSPSPSCCRSLIFIGEAVRDALDPRKTFR